MFWRAVVRKDPLKGPDMETSPAFDKSARQAAAVLDRSSAGEHSLSGHEPNRFFFNLAGRQFEDLSALSGMAHPGDGRSVIRWDYDHDGWPDLASINTNAPKLIWYRNQLGDLLRAQGEERHFLAMRFQGGNHGAKPVAGRSNRDGYGVRVRAEIGDDILVKETRCGEGFAAQNSQTLLLGLGPAQQVDKLSIRWPSGKRQSLENIPAGQLLLLREMPQEGESAWSLVEY